MLIVNLMSRLVSILFFCSGWFLSCAQADSCSYHPQNYRIVNIGEDDGFPFVKVYICDRDSTRKMKEIYFDSTYTTLGSRVYYLNNKGHGPFQIFSGKKLYREGSFLNGNYHGERKTYRDGVLFQKAYFDNGIKVGQWIEYDSNGKVRRMTNYNSNGEMQEDVRF